MSRVVLAAIILYPYNTSIVYMCNIQVKFDISVICSSKMGYRGGNYLEVQNYYTLGKVSNRAENYGL